MTPAARLSAAIAILDRILAGEPAEKALVNWARASRYAGSGDRAAVRDHVFDALRRQRSAAALGGSLSGRGLILGLLRVSGADLEALFTGEGHAPAKITEADAPRAPSRAEALDCPDWLVPVFEASLGAQFEPVMRLMQDRAPVFLRANTARLSRTDAMRRLADEGIETRPHDLAQTALQVETGARKISQSGAYVDGLVEIQDAASQAVVEALPLSDGLRVLDYCAGGGGKSLAMAARAKLKLTAHDIEPRRMADLPARAKRAGVKIALSTSAELGGEYDLVLADAPCSGSGAWRRSPDARWRLTPESLARLVDLQADVLAGAAAKTRKGGVLAYATCSMIAAENSAQIETFIARNPRFSLLQERHLTPLEGGDGFYLALLQG